MFWSFNYDRNPLSIVEIDYALSWSDLVYKLVTKVSAYHICCSEFLAHIEVNLYYI